MLRFAVVVGFLCQVIAASILYVGTEGNILYTCEFNEQTGALSLKGSTAATFPSFIALHSSGKYLYTVNEVDKFENVTNSGGITSYKIDSQSGALSKINSVPTFGGSPAHIGFDGTFKWLGVANYRSGNYGVWAVQEDFSVAGKPSWFHQDSGSGPMPNQDGPHAHEFVFNPANNFAVIPDLGTDSWMSYTFNSDTGALSSLEEVIAPAGSGPRHIVFHPHLPYAYGVSEIASTVTVFAIPATLTSLRTIQIISSLETPQPSAAAELQFSPNGEILYASNRLTGKNGTIAIFSIDKATGELTNIGYLNTLGITPRFFTLSKDGRFVLVAHQDSNNINVFARNVTSGFIENFVGSLEHIVAPSTRS